MYNMNNNTIIVIILSLFVLYYVYMRSKIGWTSRSTPKFGSYAPVDRYDDVRKEFGKPDMIDRAPGGGAIWTKPTMVKLNKPWEMIMILDEAIPHSKPAPHADFLYSWVKLKVPNEDTLHDILRLSDSLTYDPLKKVLRVRCHFMGANLATAVLAIRLAQNKLSLDEIINENLYAKYIFKTAKSHKTYDPEAVVKYENEIREYVNANF